jgi:hypothetical protein
VTPLEAQLFPILTENKSVTKLTFHDRPTLSFVSPVPAYAEAFLRVKNRNRTEKIYFLFHFHRVNPNESTKIRVGELKIFSLSSTAD